jgi:hypothetical protein
LRHHPVVISFSLATCLCTVPAALAIPIPVDLGSTGIVEGVRQVSVTAPDVSFQGQNIIFDLSFQSDQFVRLFTATTFFQIDIFFRINNAPIPQNFAGSGYLTDKNGQALGPSVTLQAFPVTNLVSEIGVDFLLRPLTSNSIPADAYGVRLDLTLPDSPGFGFVNTPAPGAIVFDGNIFGIGPGIPANVIPEGGCTFVLFALAFGAVLAVRICFPSTVIHTLQTPKA